MPQLITTLGPRTANELGLSLPYEHVFVDLRTPDQPGYAEADTEWYGPTLNELLHRLEAPPALFRWLPTRRWYPMPQQLRHTPTMIGEPCHHPRRPQYLLAMHQMMGPTRQAGAKRTA